MRLDRRVIVWATAASLLGALTMTAVGCAPPEPTGVPGAKAIPEADRYDPAAWGRVYPLEYRSWLSSKEARQPGSVYKRGGEGGAAGGVTGAAEATGSPIARQFDKLSEYPYMAALTKGIGFSVEYNEPRGHYWALIDQNAIDPARLKAGGVCLACKSPYFDKLLSEQGQKIYPMKYTEAMGLIPVKHRTLGPSCVDCHDSRTMQLRSERTIVREGLAALGKTTLSDRERQIVVCGQCHATYVIPKSAPATPGAPAASSGLFLPWQGSKWGGISIENIIAAIEASPTANHEWTQSLTGFKLGYIRHPEIELFTNGDIHYRNGVTCVDCHMRFDVSGNRKYTLHDPRSPLADDMRPCLACHAGQEPKDLRESVLAVQRVTVGQTLKLGYQVTAVASLFHTANSELATTSPAYKDDYAAAKAAYIQAFYRAGWLGAENSLGFHNPPETARIAGDGLAYAARAEAILRSMLARGGVQVPPEPDLGLLASLRERGVRKLGFVAGERFKDPSGVAERLWQGNLKALESGDPSATVGVRP